MKVLITGAAGFIGFHLSERLISSGDSVVGIDNLNDYYDVDLKLARLVELGININGLNWHEFITSQSNSLFKFMRINLEDREEMETLFSSEKFDVVCNLAAQPGVRYSLENPYSYVQSNVVGFLNVLEGCRHNAVKHLVFASSSSIYGLNKKMPLSTKDNVDHPISLYAATKKSNELMAHSYSYLYGIPTTGLRFFTVYGPWGRPDMAIYLFTDAILKGKPINVFNKGNLSRDFTYIGDIVEGLQRILKLPPKGNVEWDGHFPVPNSSKSPYEIYNIGNSKPIQLLDFIRQIENELGLKAEMNMMEMQPGDVEKTFADIDGLIDKINYHPDTTIEFGIKKFVDWFKSYHAYI